MLLKSDKNVLGYYKKGRQVALIIYTHMLQSSDCVLSQFTQTLYRDGNCAKCRLTGTFSLGTQRDQRGGGGQIMWQEAINLECAAPGARRLDLNGAQTATETRLNCLIDWPRLQGIFLKPLCVDQ